MNTRICIHAFNMFITLQIATIVKLHPNNENGKTNWGGRVLRKSA